LGKRYSQILRAAASSLFIEMSGHESCLHDGLKALKNGGRAALLGIPAEKITPGPGQ